MESTDGNLAFVANNAVTFVRWAARLPLLPGRRLLALGILASGILGLGLVGCQTDQVAQDAINQIRAEKLATEDRYIALRHEYEKLRNRLAAQGDAEAKAPQYPSALPLIYPPGPSPLDLAPASQAAWNWDAEADFTPAAAAYSEGDSGHFVPPLQQSPHQLEIHNVQVDGGSANNSQVQLRLVVKPTDDRGRPSSPLGTYSLRLADPTQIGHGAELGTWNFSAQAIRQFFATMAPNKQAAGMPLQVALKSGGQLPRQILAEIEFYPLVGNKVVGREIVSLSPGGNSGPSIQEWAGTLPVPKGTSGLMSSGTPQASGSAATRNPSSPAQPAWRPDR